MEHKRTINTLHYRYGIVKELKRVKSIKKSKNCELIKNRWKRTNKQKQQKQQVSKKAEIASNFLLTCFQLFAFLLPRFGSKKIEFFAFKIQRLIIHNFFPV